MKKSFLLFVFLFAFILTFTNGCGNISNVSVDITPSERYSVSELNDAVETIKNYFWETYDAYTLFLIGYNDNSNETIRDNNLSKYRHSTGLNSITDIMEMSITYYEGKESHTTEQLITETFYLAKHNNDKWEVIDHGVI